MHSSLLNCFDKVILLRFYNELKFHILSRDGKMLGLSPGIKISISPKSGHGTFVLSTVDWQRCQLVAIHLTKSSFVVRIFFSLTAAASFQRFQP